MGKKKDLNDALTALEQNEFSRDFVADAIREAIITAYSKINTDAQLEVTVNPNNFAITMHEVRTVVSDDTLEYDEDIEMTLEEAQEIDPKYQVGDIIKTPVKLDVFGRTDASKIKNMLKQKIRESQKAKEYEHFKETEDEIITGKVEKIDPSGNYAIISLGLGQTASLNKKSMIPGEKLFIGQEIKVYVESVTDEKPDRRKNFKAEEEGAEVKKKKGIFIQISRRSDQLVKRLFEENVTEIKENGRPGPVEILAIAREAGKRCKIVVDSSDPNIDPIGACVGKQGQRSQNIQKELAGEKIDIVKYDRNLKVLIANALSPAQIKDPQNDVILNEETREAFVIVPDDKSSLAIGKGGINTKLASKLVSLVSSSKGREERWNIKIKSETAAEEEGIRYNDFKEVFLREEEDEFDTLKDFVEEEVIQDAVEDTIEETVETPVEDLVGDLIEEVEEAAVVEEVQNDVIEEVIKEEAPANDFDENVEDLISELNSDLSKVKTNARDEIEVEDVDFDDYEDDDYLDTLSEYEDYYE